VELGSFLYIHLFKCNCFSRWFLYQFWDVGKRHGCDTHVSACSLPDIEKNDGLAVFWHLYAAKLCRLTEYIVSFVRFQSGTVQAHTHPVTVFCDFVFGIEQFSLDILFKAVILLAGYDTDNIIAVERPDFFKFM